MINFRVISTKMVKVLLWFLLVSANIFVFTEAKNSTLELVHVVIKPVQI